MLISKETQQQQRNEKKQQTPKMPLSVDVFEGSLKSPRRCVFKSIIYSYEVSATLHDNILIGYEQ